MIFILISCDDKISLTIEDDPTVTYVKSEIPFEIDFNVTSNIQLRDGIIYFSGMVDFHPAMIQINTADISIQYDKLPLEIYPHLTAVTDNRNVYITETTMYITDKGNNIITEKDVNEQAYLTSVHDNIYIANGKKCSVINENGDTVKTYDLSGNVISLQIDSSNLYIIGKDSGNITLDIIDINSEKLKKADNSDLNIIGGNAYFIGQNEDIYICTATNLIKYNFTTKKANIVINWVNSGFFPDGIKSVIPLSDDKILLYGTDVFTDKNTFWQLERTDADNIPERTVIKVSYMEDGRNIIPTAAIKFNSISTEYKIVCEDYRTVGNNDNYEALLSSYDIDLLTGNIGDVVIMSNEINYKKYADKGVFYNLYEIIENDKIFSLDMLYDCVKKPYEINGELHVVIPEFSVNTFVGKSKNLPDKIWNINTLLELINTLPANTKLLNGMTKSNMMNTFLLAGAGEFIDIEKAVCSFDSEEFIALIEYITEFPDNASDIDYEDIIPYLNDEVYLYESTYFGSFLDYLMLKTRFGFDEDIKMIGYPSKNGSAAEIIPTNYYAISNKSGNAAGAWEFIKFLLSGETIINETKGMRYIPSSRETFRDWFESEQMLYYYFPDGLLRYRVDIEPVTEEDFGSPGRIITVNDDIIDEFDLFINSISSRSDIPTPITDIISEEIGIYLTGSKTSMETVEIIQNRISIYLSEQQ